MHTGIRRTRPARGVAVGRLTHLAVAHTDVDARKQAVIGLSLFALNALAYLATGISPGTFP